MKLTKADIDKVRHIEGFPIARDEDIIALSRPPYYTACPNPFIEDFIRENGTPYDEATDDYHREPFAADVSEGKNDPIYTAHSYHTKVPHKAIMRYILHYTKPGDIVFDGFCGTGMTGVAAQMCGCPDMSFKAQIEAEMPTVEWGARNAIIGDLSPAATFISFVYNNPLDASAFRKEANRIQEICEDKCGWMYETQHVDEKGNPIMGIEGKPIIGRIINVIWSDVFSCPSCSQTFDFWHTGIDHQEGETLDTFHCPHCGSSLTKDDCCHVMESVFDSRINKTVSIAKQIPVVINYYVGRKRYSKIPDTYDFDLLKRIDECDEQYWYPVSRMCEGSESRRNDKIGVEYVHQFYTKRNLIALACLNDAIEHSPYSEALRFMLTGMLIRSTKMSRVHIKKYFFGGGGWNGGNLAGTLYISSTPVETSILDQIAERSNSLTRVFASYPNLANNVLVTTQSLTDVVNIPQNSVDYIFTDPPFGSNLNYSELSFIWEAWLKVITNNQKEAIVSPAHEKGLVEYQALMEKCFTEYCRVLKPGHWITIEFHNSKNAVWNAIQESLQRAGFIVADVRTLDKKQGSFKQVNNSNATKQDLVISAYKPRDSFVREFHQRAGDPDMAWMFVRQHLQNVPITADGNRDGKLDVIAERQDYLLFDRMVAWHIMNGIPVPMDAHTFYDGLRQRFLERDGMFFLPDQVTEYDDKRAHMELDVQQMSFLVTDEKNAITWLNYILAQGPKTYQEIQPLYLQELHQSKQEKMPELLDMLRENFVQDEKGAWYIPDLNNAADLAKVRHKALLKEFYDSCVPGKGKLKVFRMEAIRAGFDECWKQRDFATIVSVGERLPEAALQEDQTLLMYYDNACSRV